MFCIPPDLLLTIAPRFSMTGKFNNNSIRTLPLDYGLSQSELIYAVSNNSHSSIYSIIRPITIHTGSIHQHYKMYTTLKVNDINLG